GSSVFGTTDAGACPRSGRQERRTPAVYRIPADDHSRDPGGETGSAMNETWQKVVTRFDALKPRERTMVFVAGAVLIGWLVFMMAIDNELARNKRLSADISRQR